MHRAAGMAWFQQPVLQLLPLGMFDRYQGLVLTGHAHATGAAHAGNRPWGLAGVRGAGRGADFVAVPLGEGVCVAVLVHLSWCCSQRQCCRQSWVPLPRWLQTSPTGIICRGSCLQRQPVSACRMRGAWWAVCAGGWQRGVQQGGFPLCALTQAWYLAVNVCVVQYWGLLRGQVV